MHKLQGLGHDCYIEPTRHTRATPKLIIQYYGVSSRELDGIGWEVKYGEGKGRVDSLSVSTNYGELNFGPFSEGGAYTI